jgi:hypothetical protein
MLSAGLARMRIVTHPELMVSPHAEICSRIITRFGQEYVPTHIVLDSSDYTKDHSVIDEFKDIAFTWTRDRPTNSVPFYFAEIARNPACTHLVWLSRKALTYPEPMFIWVLAHELRHVHQSRQRFQRDETRRVAQRLRRKPSYSNLLPSLFAPEEIDSELFALRVVGALYGEDELNSFLAMNPLPRCPYPAYTNLLQEAASSLQT